MKALAGASAFGLVPHPWMAGVGPCIRHGLPRLSVEQAREAPATRHRGESSERMATRDEIARLRSELESAGA